MNVNEIMQKDRSGIATLLIVVIIVIILAGVAVTAYVILSSNDNGNDNGNGDDKPVTKQTWAPGTVMTYSLSLAGKPTGELKIEIIGQNANEYFIKQTAVFGLEGFYGYGVDYKTLPAGAVKTGTGQFETNFGTKTLEIWEYTDPSGTTVKAYIDPTSNIMYKGESEISGLAAIYTLKGSEIKWQDSYTESGAIGKTYKYSAPGGYGGEITCVADCMGGKYGIKYDLKAGPTYFLSNYPQGLPADAEDKETTEVISTIDGDKTLQKWVYESLSQGTTFYVDPSTHIVYRFVVPIGSGESVTFNLTTKPA
jgi:hypothetical protein